MYFVTKEILNEACTDTKLNSTAHTYPPCQRSISLVHVPLGGQNRRNSRTCLEMATCFSVYVFILSSVTIRWFKYCEVYSSGWLEDRRKRGETRELAEKETRRIFERASMAFRFRGFSVSSRSREIIEG